MKPAYEKAIPPKYETRQKEKENVGKEAKDARKTKDQRD